MMEWSSSKLSALLEKVIDNRGKTPPLADEGIETTSLTGEGKFPDYFLVRKRVSQETFDTWFRAGHPRRGDILVATVGAYIGSAAMMRAARGCVAQNLVGLRANTAKADPDFLYYYLSWDRTQQELKRLDIGSAQPSLKVPHLLNVEIPQPALPVQRRIAGILSAYDELMENSQRRIRILEAMASALHREWFIRFRYPGSEPSTRPLGHPSPTGRRAGDEGAQRSDIPKGWEGKFDELATIERDGINPFEFPEEEFEHFSLPAFDNGRQPAIELGAAILSGKYCIDDSTVLLSKLNPRIPRIWLPVPSGQRRAITSTEFLGLKPQLGVTREFIYAKCCSDEFAGQFGSLAIGTSTSHQRVKPDNLLAMPSTVPDRKIIARFSSLVAPMLTASQQLRAKIQNLRRTRDLLLPRLLSGQWRWSARARLSLRGACRSRQE